MSEYMGMGLGTMLKKWEDHFFIETKLFQNPEKY
jgi:hypothetical protein